MIDALPDGYAEELIDAETGLALAAEIVAGRQRGKGPRTFEPPGQPVYGMPGRRFTPGQGVQ